MRVLVTGGAGYIGSHVAKALASAGHEPVTLDNLIAGHSWAVRWGPLVEGDLADAALLASVLQTWRIEAVVHMAARAYIGESMRDPRAYYRTNLTSTLTLLDAMLDAGVGRLVFSSSCATYGIPDRIPITEELAQRPINPYGETKLAVERALAWYGRAYGLQWSILRFFNAAGADLDGEIGEEHDPETHLIPLAMRAVLGDGPMLEVYGADYPTADGTAVRDYVHVTDLANAHVRVLDYLASGGESVSLNLGSGCGYSVRQLLDAVAHVAGRTVPVRQVPRRLGDPPVLVADASAAARVLGWAPQFSSLDTMIATAWHWHANRGRP